MKATQANRRRKGEKRLFVFPAPLVQWSAVRGFTAAKPPAATNKHARARGPGTGSFPRRRQGRGPGRVVAMRIRIIVTCILLYACAVLAPPPVRGEGRPPLFHTVQLGSFARQADAERAFDRLLSQWPAAARHELRIEKVGQYYALRIGRFTSRDPGRQLQAELRPYAGTTLLMQAHILADRTVRTTASQTLLTTPPEERPDTPSPPPPPPGQQEEQAAARERPPAGKGEEGAEEEAAPDATAEPPRITVRFVAELKSDDLGRPLTNPSIVFTDPAHQEIYAVAGGTARVAIFDRDLYPVASFASGRGVTAPTGGVVDQQGRVFLAQIRGPGSGPQLTVYNGAFFVEKRVLFAAMPDGNAFQPAQVTVNPKTGVIYVTGAADARVCTLNPDLSFRSWFLPSAAGQHGNGGETPPPPVRDVYADREGYLYFLSEDQSRIDVFDQEETFVLAFGAKGGTTGKLSRPRALAVLDHLRLIAVVDYMRHVLVFFDLNGAFLGEAGGLGWGPRWFAYPTHVAALEPDRLVVADNFNHRLQVLRVEVSTPLPRRRPAGRESTGP